MTRNDRVRISAYLEKPYSRVLVPQEQGGFTAEILEFPGCFAEGDTVEEAFTSLEDAATAWLAACLAGGRPVPEPLTNYDVSGRFALRLPRSLYQRAGKVAASEGVSLNQFIMTALAERLGAQVAVDWIARLLTDVQAVTKPKEWERVAENATDETIKLPDADPFELEGGDSATETETLH